MLLSSCKHWEKSLILAQQVYRKTSLRSQFRKPFSNCCLVDSILVKVDKLSLTLKFWEEGEKCTFAGDRKCSCRAQSRRVFAPCAILTACLVKIRTHTHTRGEGRGQSNTCLVVGHWPPHQVHLSLHHHHHPWWILYWYYRETNQYLESWRPMNFNSKHRTNNPKGRKAAFGLQSYVLQIPLHMDTTTAALQPYLSLMITQGESKLNLPVVWFWSLNYCTLTFWWELNYNWFLFLTVSWCVESPIMRVG